MIHAPRARMRRAQECGDHEAMDLLDRMATFVRIVDGGSLSAAARGARLSQAAVSRQLAALEAELGARLIVRSTRRLQITAEGRRWYEHSVRLLRELDDARAELAGGGGPRGRVVISAPITVGLAHVVPRLERLSQRHRQLEIDLRLEDHVIDLVGDAVDVAVRAGLAPPDTTAIVAHPLLRFRRVLVAAPSYLRRRPRPRHPRDLAQHDGLLLSGRVGAAPWRFIRRDAPAEACEVAPRPRLRCHAPLVLREWAVAGAGVALLPEWLRGSERELIELLPEWTTPEVPIWALHRAEMRGAPRIRAVIAALTDPSADPGAA
jgi:DNA-binding transcriptional LysR family regulator